MKRVAKKIVCLAAVMALCAALLAGCKKQDDKTLFEYAGNEVTYKEAHVYARIMQYSAEQQYASYLGDKLWSTQVGTDKKGKKITMQDSIKDNVINQIKTVKVLADHADDYKVKLTSDEKKQLDESVKSFTKNELGKTCDEGDRGR